MYSYQLTQKKHLVVFRGDRPAVIAWLNT
jgi:hypothetical protein